MHAEDAVRVSVREDFNFAFCLAESKRASIGSEGENSFSVRSFGLLKFIFGFADSRNLWLRVRDAWNGIIVHVAVTRNDLLDASDAFLLRFVRQHRAANHVADGINAFGRCG